MGSEWRKLGVFGIIVADVVGLPLGGYWLGTVIAAHAELPDGLAVVPAGLGMAFAFWHIYRIAKREL